MSMIQGYALKWQPQGWLSAQGPIIDVDKWEEVLQAFAGAQCTFAWGKVPSHVQLPGNERAAERGRLSSPLYLYGGLFGLLKSPPQADHGGVRLKAVVQPAPLMPTDDTTPMLLSLTAPLRYHTLLMFSIAIHSLPAGYLLSLGMVTVEPTGPLRTALGEIPPDAPPKGGTRCKDGSKVT